MSDMSVDFTTGFDGGEGDLLLDGFDFDSFLNTEDTNGSLGFGSDSAHWAADSGEVGAGDS
jgi:hypothetical protein